MAVVDLGMPYLGKNAQGIHISNSEIQVFKECKRKWFLQYYVGLHLKKIKVTGPLPLGTRIHAALEEHYGGSRDAVEEYMALLKIDRDLFMDSPDSAFEDKVKEFNDEAELGRLMVEGYLEWVNETAIDADLEVLGVETSVSFEVLDGRVILQGKLDMKVRNRFTGMIEVWDNKTAQTFTTYHQTAHMSEQLMLYIMLEKLNPETVDPVDGGVYNLLKKVKRTARAHLLLYHSFKLLSSSLYLVYGSPTSVKESNHPSIFDPSSNIGQPAKNGHFHVQSLVGEG